MNTAQKLPTGQIEHISGQALCLPGDDIDTDRIIPARFLKCITFSGLGQYAFYDERYDKAGQPLAHPLNDRPQASIIVAGANFGCGSSREHAPQALLYHGIRGILALSFAEIFAGNCNTLGIACLSLSFPDQQAIFAALTSNPAELIEIDIAAGTVTLGELQLQASIPQSMQGALLAGSWDPLQELLEAKDLVLEKGQTLPYWRSFQHN